MLDSLICFNYCKNSTRNNRSSKKEEGSPRNNQGTFEPSTEEMNNIWREAVRIKIQALRDNANKGILINKYRDLTEP